MTDAQNREFSGYHKFRNDDGSEYGSFEVFHYDSVPDHIYFTEQGWYWWPCFPGCLPDSEQPNGPFPTAEGAYLDAMDGKGELPNHGDWAIPSNGAQS